MTKKKSEKTETVESEKTETTDSKKLILYEAVRDNPTKKFIIIGALSKADLLKQYRYEKSVYGIKNITPSITMDELNKIIKEFIGE